MKKELNAVLLILLIFCSNNLFAAASHENMEPVCYSATIYYYWALDFVPTDPLMSLTTPSLKNSYSFLVDRNQIDTLFSEIISESEEHLTILQKRGLKPPVEDKDFLYFYFLRDPSNYIRYDGKTFMTVTSISGEFELYQLKGIEILRDGLDPKLEVVRDIVRTAIYEKFWDETRALNNKYAPNKHWSIEKFHIFTEYVVNIKNIKKTEFEEFGVSQELIDYIKENLLPRYELEVYPKKYTNQNQLELRGYNTNIIIHNDDYEYDLHKSHDSFDMFIILKQIERICNESLDMLDELKDVPDSKEKNFLLEFEERWYIIRNIQAFMDISTFYIEKHKSFFSVRPNDNRWMIEHNYMQNTLNVEPRILEAKAKAISYDLKYQTRKDLYLMEKANEQYKNAQNQLSKTQDMLELNEDLLCFTVILVLIGILSLVLSLVFSFYYQRSQFKKYQKKFEIIPRNLRLIGYLKQRRTLFLRKRGK
jgi:hypothetical protein